MTRVVLAGVIAALAGFFGLSDLRLIEQGPPAKSEGKPVVLSMELLAGRPLVRVSVNSKGPFAFLLSPEAETTLVDRTLAAELHLKPQDPASGGSPLDVELELGSTKTTVPAALTDMAQFVPEFGPGARPRGVISLSVWKNQLVTIDYPGWRVTIEPGALPEADGREVFDLSSAREFTVPLVVAERSVPCRVDPSFSGGILVPSSFVKELPLVGRSISRGSVKIPSGVFDVQEVRLAVSVKLGAFEFPNPVIEFSERLTTAIVGGQTLGGFSITYDLTNGRARLERQKGPPGRD
jgi:hypothetical protein